MKLRLHSAFTNAILAVILGGLAAVASGEIYGEWNIEKDQKGKITKMSVYNPKTSLAIEQEISIEIDQEYVPIRGTVKFRNGVQRELNPREALFYWDEFKGGHTLWTYLGAENKLVTYDPKTGDIPPEAFGRATLLITNDGKEYIGKINSISTNQDWFMLEIGGNAIHVYKKAIATIRQIK